MEESKKETTGWVSKYDKNKTLFWFQRRKEEETSDFNVCFPFLKTSETQQPNRELALKRGERPLTSTSNVYQLRETSKRGSRREKEGARVGEVERSTTYADPGW